ncbi:pectate lyase family protein [Pedobacter sandarakinus]|uniref:pectate lyase family protein n=1 Tax=Pedobacter sandarakinus TaxID=353156 RepID=UPI002246D0E5|nr:pectate lyase [Pedobacter sandarakinus]MCX2574308.1 pectate lyase [Pedobacter sandarakinus]
MQRKTKLFRKVTFFSLLLTTIIFFSNCKKEFSGAEDVVDTTDTFSDTTKSLIGFNYSGKLPAASIKAEAGFAYSFTTTVNSDGDTDTEPNKSTLKLYENGVEIGPAHSVLTDIRDVGKGRFRHWGNTLYFSASDNSNPRTNGRTYSVVITDAAATPPQTSTPVTSKPSGAETTAGLMGYAMVNGTTTGGQGGVETTVTTLAQLKAAMSDNVTRIVYVSGTIKGAGEDPIYAKSNKSLIGRSGAVLEGLEFFIFGVNNLIFQNITFKNYVVNAALQIKERSHHIWVDHCDFSTDRSHGWDYWGKDITITREADYVTVSWSKFHDTNLSVLISGGIAGHEADAGKLHVTMHHNFWYNVSEREPSMNYGRVHMFNNYHLNNSGYSIAARAGGIVRTDNEYFSNCAMPLVSKINTDPEGYFSGVTTNIYDKSGSNAITTAISNWVPEYSYSAYLNDAASVPSIVMNGAGPK